MIESVEFKNFKILRDSKLPLQPFTLLIGPNGSGKSTALEGIKLSPQNFDPSCFATNGIIDSDSEIQIGINFKHNNVNTSFIRFGNVTGKSTSNRWTVQINNEVANEHIQKLQRFTIFSFVPTIIAEPVTLQPKSQLGSNGEYLAGVLDRLRDNNPERFEQLNQELNRWLPEFDQVLFDTPGSGTRSIKLRTTIGAHQVPAQDLSEGTLFAIALLTLTYIPNPPAIIGIEEPDRGIHIRLLREVKDALYRLAYPDQYGLEREPVQVIATTHSPYMLDLFRDHPEEIVVAQKTKDNVEFTRLSDMQNIDDILQDTHLGDAWYSGILGGVPAGS